MSAILLLFAFLVSAHGAEREIIVNWYGADPADGAADTSAIQAAFDAVPATGAVVRFPPGIWNYDGIVTIPDNTEVSCAGAGSTIFKNNGSTKTFMDVATTNGASGISIHDCGFDANGYNAADFLDFIGFNGGTGDLTDINVYRNHFFDSNYPGDGTVKQRQYILLIDCHDCYVTENKLEHGGRIKVGRPGERFWITDNNINTVNDNGITIMDSGFGDMLTRDCYVERNIVRNTFGVGISVGSDGEAQTEAITIKNCHIRDNIIIDPGGSAIQVVLPKTAEDVFVERNITILTTESPLAGINVSRQDSSTSDAKNIHIRDNTILERGSSYTLAALNIDGNGGQGYEDLSIEGNVLTSRIRLSDADVDGLRLINNVNLGTGVFFATANNPTIAGLLMADNESLHSSVGSGAMVGLGTTATIEGDILRNKFSNAGAGGDGLGLGGGGTFTLNVLDNIFDVTGTAIATGTPTGQVRRNVGYVTENNGVGTVADSTTSITVAHGLDVTPAVNDFSVVGTNSPTNDPGHVWIDTITSTQFNINVSADPGAGGATFAWSVIVQ